MITVHSIYTVDTEAKLKALQAQVDKMNANDDWTYTIILNPNSDGPKTAVVKIFDENEKFISNL